MNGSVSPCRLCGVALSRVIATESFQGVPYHTAHCAACDLYQTRERSDLATPTYAHLRPEEIDAERIWCQGAHKSAAFRQWTSLMRRHSPRLAGRLLDVGCGTGGFLHHARALGLEPFGFDASSAQAEVAGREFPGVRCAVSVSHYLRILGQTDLRFDFVSMWDVLEHLQDPVASLREVESVLAPNGILFVSVPNGGALGWKLGLGRLLGRAPALLPWEHVCYFTPGALRKCLTSAGLVPFATGAVTCYPRPPSPAELVRRLGFRVLNTVLPSRAPQIWGIGIRQRGDDSRLAEPSSTEPVPLRPST